jgi:hypothetical protein
MTLVCRNNCFDREPWLVAESPRANWLKCGACGVINIRLKQEVRGAVWRGGKQVAAVVECHGEADPAVVPAPVEVPCPCGEPELGRCDECGGPACSDIYRNCFLCCACDGTNGSWLTS